MLSRHGMSLHLRRLSQRYPVLRRLEPITIALILLWLYIIYWGERSVFHQHIEACDWDRWESWPQDATPHRMVLIADPQLVDPHTYPGRLWPLSTLTERYTDAYMAHNFRLINSRLDPDSIVFLGDLFDGGREWRPSNAQKYTRRMFKQVKFKDVPPGGSRPSEIEEDLKAFTPGEDGRWKAWDERQWRKDLTRFSRIFWAPNQLYPEQKRELLPAYDTWTDPLSVENGASNVTWREYATAHGKSRRLIASLPGNHDVGFGAGVQWRIRDRFQIFFDEGNRVDVLGNHTFVSIDTPSLSARSQWLREGGETSLTQLQALEHIWQPSSDFINIIQGIAERAVGNHLRTTFTSNHHTAQWQQRVTDVESTDQLSDTHLRSRRNQPAQLPTVVLSHVPFYRDKDEDCGPLRERGRSIPIAMGYQYQNVLTPALSRDIVSRAQGAGEIVHMFSGDDHDYCDVTHRYNLDTLHPGNPANDAEHSKHIALKSIREITVKSFSWAMGVRRPGFELVSLWNPIDADGNPIGTPRRTIQTQLCLLPDQLGTFLDYALVFAFTLLVLLADALYTALHTETVSSDVTSSWLGPKRPFHGANGIGNGHTYHSLPNPRSTSGRHRASSTSTSLNHAPNNNILGVQRNFYNTRTRNASPASYDDADSARPSPGSQFSGSGYFSKSTFEEVSDEESKIGAWNEAGARGGGGGGGDDDDDESDNNDIDYNGDKQSRWDRRGQRHPRNKLWMTLHLFQRNMVTVGMPSLLWYFWLIWRG